MTVLTESQTKLKSTSKRCKTRLGVEVMAYGQQRKERITGIADRRSDEATKLSSQLNAAFPFDPTRTPARCEARC
jgi:hypothetical protein